jgi:hypothetical protein
MKNGWNPFRKECILQIPYKVEDKLTQVLKPGDILLYRAHGHQLLGNLISTFTDSPYSHAEVYVGDGWSVDAAAIGVTLSMGMHKEIVDVFRLKGGLTDHQRRIVVGKAYQSLARPYDYFLLFAFPFFTRKMAARRAANGAFMCSENVAWCYHEAGIDLGGKGTPVAMEAPADLGASKLLDWLGFYDRAKKVPDGVRNKPHRIQGKPNWFSRLLIKLFADPFSVRDEYYSQLQKSQARARKGWKPAKNVGSRSASRRTRSATLRRSRGPTALAKRKP